ncbi:YdcH family protein [Thalassobius sp. Cn5-15]|uniref:YdcH family protein n=1 Tax=Thalassobius sp. Cn5-15 TaxID=2917763 RepID=UPI001EF1F547|nr:YdcH family protein [Thalassobius sp. Cn5-15]MCG7493399.1 YdcH family protein [Thalassobius sp. Cn5-15]
MGLTSHIEELKKKHSDLSHRVEVAQRSPGTSDAEIADMKKQKLRLKEEIERLSAEHA